MCGRYCYEKATRQEVVKITGMDLDIKELGIYGDICPSMKAVTIVANNNQINNRLVPEVMTWGFPMKNNRQLIINARGETALEKPMFSDSIMKRRCIIPANHFYEWDRDKNKAEFSWKEHDSILMLGFYNMFGGIKHFVILTTAANDSMIKTHDRMPIIIDESRVFDWIMDNDSVNYFLKEGSPLLYKKQEYEQLRFFNM